MKPPQMTPLNGEKSKIAPSPPVWLEYGSYLLLAIVIIAWTIWVILYF